MSEKVIYENPEKPWSGAVGHKFVRLTEPVYYVPINPYTNDAGLLPHDGGEMPEWVRGRLVFAIDRNGTPYNVPAECICNWRQIDSYRVVGKQEDGSTADEYEPTETDRRTFSTVHGICENGDDPEQFASGNPTPFVDKPRTSADATGHQYQDVYTEDERRHRNELAARLGVPVPGMDEWMEGPLREAQRKELIARMLARMPSENAWAKGPGREFLINQAIDGKLKMVDRLADAMIEREDSE